MSTLNMLAEQPTFAGSAFTSADTVNPMTASFETGNAFPGDFLGLSLQDDDQVWNLSPTSPTLGSWNPKTEPAFVNPSLERDLKNSRVRNGQPTPPPFEDKKTVATDDLFAMSPSWEDSMAKNTNSRQRRSTSDSSESSATKRRKVREHKQSSSGPEDESKQDRAKREKFLERNRLAASKCRQKKKEHTMMLETRYKEQSQKKEELVAEIARLRSEILGLKNEVLKHAQCGDEPIKLHLAQMVKKITYNDSSEGHDPTDPADVTDSTTSPSIHGAMSFGFDDPLQLDSRQAVDLEQQLRRESDASLAFSADDNFDDLINV